MADLMPEGVTHRVKTLEVVQTVREGVSHELAPVEVAGVAGVGCIGVGVLNAAMGSTQPAVDDGWIWLETMIGQSGKMCSQDLYIGVGLSAEFQQMVGIVVLS